MSDTVVEFQQRPVERLDRLGIGEIDGLACNRVRSHELLQLRTAFDQLREIVRRSMWVARMQFPFRMIRLFGRGFQSALIVGESAQRPILTLCQQRLG